MLKNRLTFNRFLRALTAAVLVSQFQGPLSAGPPYFTDDPEPVEYGHSELYIASQSMVTRGSADVTMPHVEFNYGLIPGVQIHVIAPFKCAKEPGASGHFGPGDAELGIKWRFLNESGPVPMMGVFPLVVVPTGYEKTGLGDGRTRYFLPLWLQKKWGKWSSYGGGGCWIDAGARGINSWNAGWQVQRELTGSVSAGAELFYRTPIEGWGRNGIGFNAGVVIDFGESHHLLLSAGRDIRGPNVFTGYISYQYTTGTGGSE